MSEEGIKANQNTSEKEYSSSPVTLTPDGKLTKVIIKEGVGEPPRKNQEVYGKNI